MYTKENAEMHKLAMKRMKYDLKRPRTRKDFNEVKSRVSAMSVNSFEQGVQNTQSSFENVFKNTMNIIFFKMILIANNGTPKKLKKEAKICLEKLSKCMNDFEKLQDEAREQKVELNFSEAVKNQLVREFKSYFKKERRTRP